MKQKSVLLLPCNNGNETYVIDIGTTTKLQYRQPTKFYITINILRKIKRLIN